MHIFAFLPCILVSFLMLLIRVAKAMGYFFGLVVEFCLKLCLICFVVLKNLNFFKRGFEFLTGI
jgi:hypothetical protein